ncbi:MAG: HAMP domain-containing histidine kinase [Ruminococcus sp.]|nr:HAMP domain-containing histidine kinase [Ruminococcus sp.]
MKLKRKSGAEKPRLIQSTAVKVTAFILTILMTVVCMASIIIAVCMAQTEMYTKPMDEFLNEHAEGIVYEDAGEILQNVMGDWRFYDIDEYCNKRNIAKVVISSEETSRKIWSWERDGEYKTVNKCHRYYRWSYKLNQSIDTRTYPFFTNGNKDTEDVKVTICYINPPIINDNYKQLYNIIYLGYSMRYAIYAVIFLSFFLVVAAFVFLMCAAGHHKGKEEVEKGWGTGFPLDLLTAIVFVPVVVFLWPYMIYAPDFSSLLLLFVVFCAWEISLVAFCMSFALRVKLGKWWRNTVIYKLIHGIVRLVRSIPLVWRTALVISGVFLVELILMVANRNAQFEEMLGVWFVTKMLLFAAVIFIAVQLRELKQGGEAIANGDADYKIDNSKMLLPDFKAHAENLNNISRSVNIAVGEKMKSERMKTELITNVSHDIKTPLTSIINYADLIGKEECENEKIIEYSEVLLRQSERLKRLIEDLVEASKASTGNLDVVLTPIDANILLTQAVGEYEEKIKAADLEIITNEPAEPISINADGRRLWRVFDNLLNNICKYAQCGTRVYLSLERDGSDAVITFKNTSRAPLNISADELMERFVRGDESRSTEGNGLGLSIAKSLTELQNGTLSISIDGDLFKVVVRFPLV